MTTTLIVEDGTGSNPAANSYNSLAAIKTYMDDRGIVYTTDPLLISAAIQAMDFLESQRYKGSLYLSTQPLQWPRYLSVPNCGQYGTGYSTGYTDFGYTAIVYDDSLNVAPEYPNNVKKAQCLMTAEILKGNIPNESLVRAPFIKQQTVGPITRVYSETVGVQPSRFPAFYALLRDYLMSTGNISVSRQMGVFDADISAASELIQEFGQQVTWRKFAATVDPSKPWDISSIAHTDYSPFIAFFPPSGGMASLAFLTGSDIPEGTEYGLMAGDCGFEPSLQDVLIRTDGQKAINKINKLAPNGDAILYTVWIK